MRILELAPPWFSVPPTGYGGIERVVALLADGLVAAGHDVTLLASGGSKTAARLWTVFERPPSREPGSLWHDLRHCVEGYRRRDEFDIIHDHTGPSGAVLGSMLDGPPVVHTLHLSWSTEAAALHAALPPTLHRVAISHHQAAQAPPGVGIARVIHNAIPVERFPFRSQRRGTAGYLAFVGRASPDKSPEVAVRVARRLGRPLRMAVKLSESVERQHWCQVVEPLLDAAEVEVTINGSAAHAVEVMAGADATLFPIQWDEPFGLVMVESMACGTPIIGFAAGASIEVVQHGVTGFLVPVGDEDGLCQAVGRVGEIDPGACREHVIRRFNQQVMVGRYERLFLDLGSRAFAPTERRPGVLPVTSPSRLLAPDAAAT